MAAGQSRGPWSRSLFDFDCGLPDFSPCLVVRGFQPRFWPTDGRVPFCSSDVCPDMSLSFPVELDQIDIQRRHPGLDPGRYLDSLSPPPHTPQMY